MKPRYRKICNGMVLQVLSVRAVSVSAGSLEARRYSQLASKPATEGDSLNTDRLFACIQARAVTKHKNQVGTALTAFLNPQLCRHAFPSGRWFFLSNLANSFFLILLLQQRNCGLPESRMLRTSRSSRVRVAKRRDGCDRLCQQS